MCAVWTSYTVPCDNYTSDPRVGNISVTSGAETQRNCWYQLW